MSAAVGDVSLAMLPLAIISVPAFAISLWNAEWAVVAGLSVPALVGLAGIGIAKAVEPYRRGGRPSPGSVLATAWFIASIVCAAPFVASAVLDESASETTRTFASLPSALFESFSGLTSTGLTMTPDARELPLGLQWWRSTIQWLGGVGILYLVVAVICIEHDPEQSQDEEAEGEVGDGPDKVGPRSLRNVIGRTWMTYSLLTVAAFVGLILTGVPVWDAANLAQTAISTGGFALAPDSLASYPYAAQVVAAVVMMAAAISFYALRRLILEGDWRSTLTDHQVGWLFGLIALSVVLALLISDLPAWDATFHVISALCTGGFGTASFAGMKPTLILLIVVMVIGGSAGSTAGGIKIGRLRRVAWRCVGKTVDNPVPNESFGKTVQFLIVFAVTIALGSTLLFVTTDGFSFVDVLFETISALCTVGLSCGVTSSDLSPQAKLTLIGVMYLGRLEILAVLALVLRRVRRL
ncbi:MAG: potassium transporter TrkG [Planctomycetota bacterium]